MQYYFLREKETDKFSKGSRSGYTWLPEKTMFIDDKRPPKLYTLGAAKAQVTSAKKFNGRELEIIPVTLTLGDVLD